MKKGFYVLAATVLVTGITFCNSGKKLTEDYREVKLYCWCFSHGNEIVNKDGTKSRNPQDYQCQTFVRVKPQDVMRMENLSDSITDKILISRISQMVWKGYADKVNDNPKPDARFVLVLESPSGEEQRLTYASDYSLVYNEQFTLQYRFNVMDSLKKILNKPKFHCPD